LQTTGYASLPTPRAELQARGVAAPARLPVVGLGHSLGCKLLLLLGSEPTTGSSSSSGGGVVAANTLGHRANMFVSFNNFDAQRSVPLLEPAAKLQAALQSDDPGPELLAALAALGGGLGGALGGGLGGVDVGAAVGGAGAAVGGAMGDAADRATKAFGLGGMRLGLEDAARQASEATGAATGFDPSAAWGDAWGAATAGAAGAAGAGAGAASSSETAPEFSPSPAETDALLAKAYAVPRNLVVRMATDDLDQSFGLATLLKARYEEVWSKPNPNPAAGGGGGGSSISGGGRLEYRTLAGTHVTPNLPSLRGLSWDAADMAVGLLGGPAGAVAGRFATGQARDISETLAFEQEALCAVVAAWALGEAELCAGGWRRPEDM